MLGKINVNFIIFLYGNLGTIWNIDKEFGIINLQHKQRMNNIMIKYVKTIESQFRLLLICFCSFSSLYAVVFQIMSSNLPKSIISNYDMQKINMHNPIFLTVLGVFSIAVGIYLKNEVRHMILEEDEDEMDWESDNLLDKLSVEFIWLCGIFFIYFFVQVGIVMFFFHSVVDIQVYGKTVDIKLAMAVSSLFIYGVYRCTILKFCYKL